MKKIVLVVFLLSINLLYAQNKPNTQPIKIDSVEKYNDSVLKYHRSVAVSSEKTNNWEKPAWWEKTIDVVKGFFRSYPFTAWMLLIFFCIWLLRQIFKLFNK